MDVLSGLHGTIAVVVICGLLLLDEAGLPLPIAPSEVLLLFTGLLIASGAVSPFIIVPCVTAAMLAGLLAGYGWAHTLGKAGLSTLADKVGAEETCERASNRLADAHPLQIGLARLLPGVRPYATLVAGAADTHIRTFLLGAVPALLIWEAIWTAIGIAVGVPAAHYLGKVEKLMFQGGILLILGVVAFLAVRRATRDVEIPTRWMPQRGRVVLASTIDVAIIGAIVAGLITIARQVFGFSADTWLDVLIVAVVCAAYLFLKPDSPQVTPDGVLMRE
jgi:membrane protein DedA with SNARE-associated domain